MVIASAGVLVFQDDKVLLVKHKEAAGHLNDTFIMPCGRLDEGEKEIEAAVRELNEEAGLETTQEDLMEYPGNIYYADIPRKDGTTKSFSMRIFICKKYSGSLKESDEGVPDWYNIGDALNLNLLPNVDKAILAGKKFYDSKS